MFASFLVLAMYFDDLHTPLDFKQDMIQTLDAEPLLDLNIESPSFCPYATHVMPNNEPDCVLSFVEKCFENWSTCCLQEGITNFRGKRFYIRCLQHLSEGIPQ